MGSSGGLERGAGGVLGSRAARSSTRSGASAMRRPARVHEEPSSDVIRLRGVLRVYPSRCWRGS
eukprot:1261097-Pyramimonas_sp.AAC.1